MRKGRGRERERRSFQDRRLGRGPNPPVRPFPSPPPTRHDIIVAVGGGKRRERKKEASKGEKRKKHGEETEKMRKTLGFTGENKYCVAGGENGGNAIYLFPCEKFVKNNVVFRPTVVE